MPPADFIAEFERRSQLQPAVDRLGSRSISPQQAELDPDGLLPNVPIDLPSAHDECRLHHCT